MFYKAGRGRRTEKTLEHTAGKAAVRMRRLVEERPRCPTGTSDQRCQTECTFSLQTSLSSCIPHLWIVPSSLPAFENANKQKSELSPTPPFVQLWTSVCALVPWVPSHSIPPFIPGARNPAPPPLATITSPGISLTVTLWASLPDFSIRPAAATQQYLRNAKLIRLFSRLKASGVSHCGQTHTFWCGTRVLLD